MLLISGKGRIIIVFIHLISSLSMNINLKDTLVDDTIIVQVQPVLEQVQTVTTHFDIVGNLLWDNLFAPLLFGISIPLVYKFVKKLLKRYNLKKYQSKIIREDQYKVLVKNVCLEDKYFRVNTNLLFHFLKQERRNWRNWDLEKYIKRIKINVCIIVFIIILASIMENN